MMNEPGGHQPETTQLRIRPILPADVAEYYPLRLRALREHPEAFSSAYEDQAGLTLEVFADRFMEAPSPNRFMLGARLDGILVGNLALFRPIGVKTSHQAELARMYVAPEARRQGVGWQLLQAVLQKARQLPGLEQVSLGVTASNTDAIGLYCRAGFVMTGRVPRALKIDGEFYDFDTMLLIL